MSKSNGSGDNRDTQREEKFLDAFREHLTVKKACEAIGLGRATAYRWRNKFPEFAAAWDEVDEEVTEGIEREAYRRAVEGVDRPVFQGGTQVGSIRVYSDRLIELLLKARRPEKYRERLSIDDDREEAKRRRKELDRATEEELDRKLTGLDDNVIPISNGKAA